MGILTLLRNAFSRSRRATTTEDAPPQPSTPPAPAEAPTASAPTASAPPSPDPHVPDPRPAEHDLVRDAFTNISVPKQPPAPTTEAATSEPEAQPDVPAQADPEAERKPSTAPEPEPKAQAAPEPKTEAAPEPKPEAEAKPEPNPTPASEPETQEPAPQQPKAKDEPKPEPAPKPSAEPTATPTPAAADGEHTPQGPPAPDNESETGGAGGNTKAEGAAEATKPATPATPAAHIKQHAPTLTTAYKAATTTLKKHNLTGTRAKVYLVLDRSASMRPYYKDGSAQALADQTLALAAHLDPTPENPTVPVIFFSTDLDGTGELTLTDHETKIDDLHAELGRMGRTSYHAAVAEVLAQHEKSEDPTAPALVVFQTDGAPDARTPATQALTDAAKTHPAVHFAFVAFGDPENKAFDYLRKLDTGGNTSHFLAGETPRELTDKQLYDGLLTTWRP
ncbi:VWA domain-containing protein [Streptomyces sp. NPDC003717]|uniref:VWA domain-containing protein n=1 Tax=Streptomyces sp. NPDC003717 TaxID=3154276 RepID=UPI0033B6A248